MIRGERGEEGTRRGGHGAARGVGGLGDEGPWTRRQGRAGRHSLHQAAARQGSPHGLYEYFTVHP